MVPSRRKEGSGKRRAGARWIAGAGKGLSITHSQGLSAESEVTMKERFPDIEDFEKFSAFLDAWGEDASGAKRLFARFLDVILNKKDAFLRFKSRPGISYSLRAFRRLDAEPEGALFTLIDVIDDDPEERWLSVCFYRDVITDPEEMGDLVPNGLLGEDAACFDLDTYDEIRTSYVEQRIEEAYARSLRES